MKDSALIMEGIGSTAPAKSGSVIHVQVPLNELTVAEAKEYCRCAFREQKKIEGFWDTTCNEPFRLTQKGEEP